ncbi:MAG: GDP-L-fucose synthase family protein [Bacteroidota bacterium]
MQQSAKIFIAGGTGMVGSAIIRNLLSKGYSNLVASYRRRKPDMAEMKEFQGDVEKKLRYISLDLEEGDAVKEFFSVEKPEYVVLAAAKVGGIMANNIYRAEFLYVNLQIQNNIIHQSYLNGVKKLLFLGSSCIYPKNAPQPLKEEYLLTAPLEYTNESYAVAKIAGMKMCESYNLQYGTNYISVMPTNLYGPNDNYDLEKSHVLPALIRKMHLGKCLHQNDWEALRKDFNQNPVEGVDGCADDKQILEKLEKYGITKNGDKVTITLWGSGKPMREFLHSDDMADACVYVLENIDFEHDMLAGIKGGIDKIDPKPIQKEVRNTHINIGTGQDLTIADLAGLIKNITGYEGDIVWDAEKPDGTMRKLLDVSKLHSLGWKEKYSLEDGIRSVYERYVD